MLLDNLEKKIAEYVKQNDDKDLYEIIEKDIIKGNQKASIQDYDEFICFRIAQFYYQLNIFHYTHLYKVKKSLKSQYDLHFKDIHKKRVNSDLNEKTLEIELKISK